MSTRRAGAALAVACALLWALPATAFAAEQPPPPAGGEEVGEFEHHCIELLEGGGKIDDCQEAPNPILPETNELIWGTVSFLVLFFLLAKLAFPALRQSMEARTEKIRKSLDEAEATRAEAQTILADYQRQLADAKGEAGRVIDEARQTAESVKRDLIARAESEAEEQRRRNAEQIAAERDRVMSEVQSSVASLAVEMAERVVQASLDRDASMRLIEDYINTVGGNGASGAAPAPGASFPGGQGGGSN